MVTVSNLTLGDVQRAISLLEDMINKQADFVHHDVWMNVAATCPSIAHGQGVGMTANNTVTLSNVATNGYIGVNHGPTATAGNPVLIRGGAPAEVFIAAGETPAAGNYVYYVPGTPGIFSTVTGDLIVGMVYDTTGYSFTAGGNVKALLDIRGPGGV